VPVNIERSANEIATGLVTNMTLRGTHYSVLSVLDEINSFCRGVETFYTLTGIVDFRDFGSVLQAAAPPLVALVPKTQAQINTTGLYNLLNFKLGADGNLQVQGTTNFWNNFFISFTKVGAEVLGLSGLLETIGSGVPNQPFHALHYSRIALGQVVSTALVSPIGVIQPGELIRDVSTTGEHSLFSCLDSRVSIEIDSHLPMRSNIIVQDEKEQVSHMIAERFFENRLTTKFKFDTDGRITEKESTMDLYSGMVPFITISERNKEFHKLITSYDLRFFRFHIYVVFRKYDSDTDKWIFTKTKLPVDKNSYIDFAIRFVSEV
jgi:hypothetical protein